MCDDRGHETMCAYLVHSRSLSSFQTAAHKGLTYTDTHTYARLDAVCIVGMGRRKLGTLSGNHSG
uniref:Uncharacterized protein n=1 Tax=Parascaris univalens TaxID=6257 RepID=A0A915ANI7_PARUN